MTHEDWIRNQMRYIRRIVYACVIGGSALLALWLVLVVLGVR